MSRELTLTCSLFMVAACGDDGGRSPATTDAATDAIVIVDALPDAPLDAPPDAPPVDAPPTIPAEVTAACTQACNALGVCFGNTDPGKLDECVGECSLDLLDCSSPQVAAVQACSTEECGDEEGGPIIDCLMAIACVEM
jgi:hypothetical protein